MARRGRVEKVLHELGEIRQRGPEADSASAIGKAIGHRSGLVVAAAANLVRDFGLGQLLPALETAFDRFVENGSKTDPGCRAKSAIVTALDDNDVAAYELFRTGARLVQWEPVYGGREDSAGELRSRSVLALVHQREPDALDAVADALADPLHTVRSSAAVAAGASGSPAAAPLLRFKLRLGDDEPEVLSSALASLLTLSPHSGLELAGQMLRHDDVAIRETGGLALGESRHPKGLELLWAWLERTTRRDERKAALTSIALLRQATARARLLHLIRSGSSTDAAGAVEALAIFGHDPELATSIRQAAAENEADLSAVLDAHL